MIIINKKRLQILVLCVLVSIFAFSLQMTNNKNSEQEKEQNTVVTTATPVSGKTIVVDAGHGAPDERSRK